MENYFISEIIFKNKTNNSLIYLFKIEDNNAILIVL